jgi:hypothetical protein
MREQMLEARLIDALAEELAEEAEDVILAAGAPIGEEIAKVPKASGRPAKNITTSGKNRSIGRREAIAPGEKR